MSINLAMVRTSVCLRWWAVPCTLATCISKPIMTAATNNFKSISHDPEYYAESFDVYARRSAKYQVLATWADTIYPKVAVDKLSVVDNNGEGGKLRILGIGSGTGGMDCKMITQLLKKFPSISNTVVEPSRLHIQDYMKSVEGKGFGNVEFDWRQQTWDEFHQQYKTEAKLTRFHFISAVQSLYYVQDLETTILDLISCLEEGGILMMIHISDVSGLWHFWNRFPMFADEQFRQINSGSIRSILDKNDIKYEAITQGSRIDITCCFEEGNKEGILMTDFLTHLVKFRETASKNFVDEVLAYMRGAECSIQEGDKIFFNNDWQAIIVCK